MIDDVPKNINQRLDRISSNKQVCDNAIELCQKALNTSSHNYKLKNSCKKPQQQ